MPSFGLEAPIGELIREDKKNKTNKRENMTGEYGAHNMIKCQGAVQTASSEYIQYIQYIQHRELLDIVLPDNDDSARHILPGHFSCS